MVSRRSFLKLGGAAGAALYLTTYFGGVKRVFAQIPGGTLDPHSVPKYMTPMLIPPVMPTAGKIKNKMGKNADYYEISMKQFAQQILPAPAYRLTTRCGATGRWHRTASEGCCCTTRPR